MEKLLPVENMVYPNEDNNKNLDMNKYTYDYSETIKQKKELDKTELEPTNTLDGLKHLNNNLVIALAEMSMNVYGLHQEQEDTNEFLVKLIELLEKNNELTERALALDSKGVNGVTRKYKFNR